MGNFLNQITFCPACGGTGYTDIEDEKARQKCAECQGNGVFVKQTDALLYFNSSSYFDFARREKIKSLRIIYLVIFGAIALALIAGIYFLYKMGGQYLNTTTLSPF